MFIANRPLAFASLAYLIGATVSGYSPQPSLTVLLAWVSLVFAGTTSALLLLRRQRKEGWILILLSFMAVGTGWQTYHRIVPNPDPIALGDWAFRHGVSEFVLQGTVIAQPRRDMNRMKFEVELEELRPKAAISSDSDWDGAFHPPWKGRVEVTAISGWRELNENENENESVSGAGEEGIEYLRVGDRVKLMARLRPIYFSNPGENPLKRRRLRRGIFWQATADAGEVHREAAKAVSLSFERRVERWRSELRQSVLEGFERTMPARYAQIGARMTASMVYGMHAVGLPPSICESARRAGVLHVLVASGTQVGLLLGLIWFLHIPITSLSRGLSLLAIAVYFLITEGEASITRATLMALYLLLGAWKGLSVDALTILCFSAALISFFAPESPYNLGFQLSYAATAGLVFLGAPLFRLVMRWLLHSPSVDGSNQTIGTSGTSEWIVRLLKWALLAAVGTVCMSFAAQIAVAPLLAYHVGRVSLVAPLANLIAVPIAALMVPLAFLGAVLVAVWETIAIPFNYLSYYLAYALVRSTEFFAAPSWACLHWRMSLAEVVLCYAFIAASVYALHRLERRPPMLFGDSPFLSFRS